MTAESETLALRIGIPADIDGHGRNKQPIQDDGSNAGILQFVDHIEPFRHGGLRVDDARIVSVVMQMDVMIVVILEPAPVQIQTGNSGNEDDEGHNVVHEIHKQQGSFLLQMSPKVRGAIVRRDGIYSFAGIILLFFCEYKSFDRTFYKGKARNSHIKRVLRKAQSSTQGTPLGRWR